MKTSEGTHISIPYIIFNINTIDSYANKTKAILHINQYSFLTTRTCKMIAVIYVFDSVLDYSFLENITCTLRPNVNCIFSTSRN